MSTHGTLREVGSHNTRRVVNGEVTNFTYTEPISRHNVAKHFVDDVNNRRHDPIGLDQGWPTKRWDHRQLTFFLSIAEVNAVNTQARARKTSAVPTLAFRKNLAKQMMLNNLDDDGVRCSSPIRAQKRLSEPSSGEHDHLKRPKFTGSWDEISGTWSNVCTEYSKTRCSICSSETWMYCSCNKKVSMYVKCWGSHLLAICSP